MRKFKWFRYGLVDYISVINLVFFQEFESGKALPNPQVLGKMERTLGIKLRGKDIGKPLNPPASATGAAAKKK